MTLHIWVTYTPNSYILQHLKTQTSRNIYLQSSQRPVKEYKVAAISIISNTFTPGGKRDKWMGWAITSSVDNPQP